MDKRQGSEPVQGTETKTENERNFRKFYEERKRKRKKMSSTVPKLKQNIMKSTKSVENVFFSSSPMHLGLHLVGRRESECNGVNTVALKFENPPNIICINYI